MKQAFPSISPETKAKLQERGFKPLKTDPLPDWQNPYSNSFLTTNAALLIVGLIGRTFARKAKSSTFLWSAVLISVPLFTIVSRVRIDRNDQYLGHRKTLEERLDFSPLTRNAYHRALDLNRAYQEGLRQEINELELVLRK